MKSVVIVAGGESSRFGQNKLFAPLSGKTLIETTVGNFSDEADEIILAVNPNDMMQMTLLFVNSGVKLVVGGETRTQSVLNGLNALSDDCSVVAIHDGARPFVSRSLIKKCFEEAVMHGSAVPSFKETDAVYNVNGNRPLPVDKNALLRVQTPQTFAKAKIAEAYAKRDSSKAYADDAEIYLDCFGELNFVEGEQTNKKITFPQDLQNGSVGNGFDVHPYKTGRKLILCGVEIPYEKGLDGHSDADVAVHAIMDAILTGIGERDIGVQFPDTDEQYKGISSMALLKKVADIANEKNAKIQSVSCVIMAQEPKLAPYIPQMCKNVAEVLNVPSACVNVSATTTEGLGIIGNKQGVAAQAVCLIF